MNPPRLLLAHPVHREPATFVVSPPRSSLLHLSPSLLLRLSPSLLLRLSPLLLVCLSRCCSIHHHCHCWVCCCRAAVVDGQRSGAVVYWAGGMYLDPASAVPHFPGSPKPSPFSSWAFGPAYVDFGAFVMLEGPWMLVTGWVRWRSFVRIRLLAFVHR